MGEYLFYWHEIFLTKKHVRIFFHKNDFFFHEKGVALIIVCTMQDIFNNTYLPPQMLNGQALYNGYLLGTAACLYNKTCKIVISLFLLTLQYIQVNLVNKNWGSPNFLKSYLENKLKRQSNQTDYRALFKVFIKVGECRIDGHE